MWYFELFARAIGIISTLILIVMLGVAFKKVLAERKTVRNEVFSITLGLVWLVGLVGQVMFWLN